MIWFVILFCSYTLTLCDKNQSRLVQLAQGPVLGYKDPDYRIYAFYGIPYAKSPTGKDRFKAPLPAPVWSEIFVAVDKQIVCPQIDLLDVLPASRVIKEDCLITNIYVPEILEKNLPVVIIVHGGGYITGFGNMFTPKKLVESNKVIAVTFNYRIGAHGFLCLGTKDVPGNAGMKDQVALVRWVKMNIRSFGGNPDDIIITGFSSGSAAAEMLLLSKLTKGFFKKIIPESASAIAPFNVQLDPIETAKSYARLLNFHDVDNLYALEHFYKTIPYEFLNSVDLMHRKDSTTVMVPCIERDNGQERFLDESPINTLMSGKFEKIPTLYGFTPTEGMFRFPLFGDWKDTMNVKFSDFLPADLHFKSEEEKDNITEQIRRFYFGDKQVSEETILAYVDYFTDVFFASPMLRSVKYQVKAGHNEIYLYLYSYFEDSLPTIPYSNVRGITHCAQTFGILDGYWNFTSIDESNVSEDMKQRKIFMKKIWINFMTTGKPIPPDSDLPAWPPVGSDWLPYMNINKTLELQESPLLIDRVLFWEKIYDKYYRRPVPPTWDIKVKENIF